MRRSPAAAAAAIPGSERDSADPTYLVARVVEVGQVFGAVVEELFNAHRNGRRNDHLTDTGATMQARPSAMPAPPGRRADGCERMVMCTSLAHEWDECRVLSCTVLSLCVYARVHMCVRACVRLPVLGREMPAAVSLAEPSAAQPEWPAPLSAPWPQRPPHVAPAVKCDRSKRAALAAAKQPVAKRL